MAKVKIKTSKGDQWIQSSQLSRYSPGFEKGKGGTPKEFNDPRFGDKVMAEWEKDNAKTSKMLAGKADKDYKDPGATPNWRDEQARQSRLMAGESAQRREGVVDALRAARSGPSYAETRGNIDKQRALSDLASQEAQIRGQGGGALAAMLASRASGRASGDLSNRLAMSRMAEEGGQTQALAEQLGAARQNRMNLGGMDRANLDQREAMRQDWMAQLRDEQLQRSLANQAGRNRVDMVSLGKPDAPSGLEMLAGVGGQLGAAALRGFDFGPDNQDTRPGEWETRSVAPVNYDRSTHSPSSAPGWGSTGRGSAWGKPGTDLGSSFMWKPGRP